MVPALDLTAPHFLFFLKKKLERKKENQFPLREKDKNKKKKSPTASREKLRKCISDTGTVGKTANVNPQRKRKRKKRQLFHQPPWVPMVQKSLSSVDYNLSVRLSQGMRSFQAIGSVGLCAVFSPPFSY